MTPTKVSMSSLNEWIGGAVNWSLICSVRAGHGLGHAGHLADALGEFAGLDFRQRLRARKPHLPDWVSRTSESLGGGRSRGGGRIARACLTLIGSRLLKRRCGSPARPAVRTPRRACPAPL
jgi:hypothetical protein